MALTQSSVVQILDPIRIASATGLLIEPLEDGTALVFDQSTGATTLINDRALTLLNLLRYSGVVSERALSSMANQYFSSASEFSDILIALEKSRLVIRC